MIGTLSHGFVIVIVNVCDTEATSADKTSTIEELYQFPFVAKTTVIVYVVPEYVLSGARIVIIPVESSIETLSGQVPVEG